VANYDTEKHHKHTIFQVEVNSKFLTFVKTQLEFTQMCFQITKNIKIIQKQLHEHTKIFLESHIDSLLVSCCGALFNPKGMINHMKVPHLVMKVVLY
jgi:hypothetical protein